MLRDTDVFLNDIIEACTKVIKYTNGMDYESFMDNDLVVDAVIKNILVIGEAVKNLPTPFRSTHSGIEWRKMAGMRDMLIHGYFSVNYQILWDVVKNKLPELRTQLLDIINKES
ncbi:DUF86 domain-containing protein [Sporosarcina sp. FSL W8-0480]|uniref:HepT-like ribonuclease domain-containing protein n=1 Tax=Sporosarcina sp. FSL W8-0480 TaxID=2954701 RepID=UPI0030DD5AA6